MNRKIAIFLGVLLISITQLSAKTERNGFAIVIDPVSLKKAQSEINEYRNALADVQGFHVYTVVDKWGVPDSIRAALIGLYNAKNNPIAGAVFIGDIPVPMVRDAQFLTSAFRMNQTQPWRDSSVPSDRYYDDFGMQFDYLKKDSIAPYFYYSLSYKGDQFVRPDIFSGRIRPTDADDTSRYEKLRQYLRKAVSAKRNPEPFNSLFIYTGSGSLNESKMAHMSEMVSMYEHFPQLRNLPNGIRYTDYTDVPDIKSRLMDQMMQPDLSIGIMHHHGDFDTQYLSKVDSMNLVLADFQKYGYRPNCRVAIYDACYNGVFHQDNSIANEYIFQPGKTILGIGGSVNVLQDKWPDKLIGLLAEGVMAGIINQYTADLEMHVVGDPTYVFRSEQSHKLNNFIINANDKQWVKVFNQKDATADMHVLAMEKLLFSAALTDDMLLATIQSAANGLERLEAYTILMRRNSPLFPRAINAVSTDTYELLQRYASIHMSKYGGNEVITSFADRITAVETTPRVEFDAMEGIQFFPDEDIKSALEASLERRRGTLVDFEAHSNAVMAKYKKYSGRWKDEIIELCNGEMSDRKAIRQAGFMRLYCPPYLLDRVAEFTERCTNDTLRLALLDVLGWQRLSFTSPKVYEVVKRMSTNDTLPEFIKGEAIRTMKRIKPIEQ